MGWDNNVHAPVHTGTATGSGLSSSVTAGVGWGGIITFMFLYTHRHGNRQWSFIISYCWGGVGWDNNVHAPVTGTATGSGLSSSVTAGVGWGGVITFMFQEIALAVSR